MIIALLESEDETKPGFIDLAFGFESVLRREDFVNVVKSKRCNWILSDHKFRQHMNTFDDETVMEECLTSVNDE